MSAPDKDDAELEKLAEDWITLWQSEIAGLASDREAAEAWAAAASAGGWVVSCDMISPSARPSRRLERMLSWAALRCETPDAGNLPGWYSPVARNLADMCPAWAATFWPGPAE